MRRPISLARLARDNPRAASRLTTSLRSGVSAALLRLTPADGVILSRLTDAAEEFFAADEPIKADASALALCAAVGPQPVRLGWRRPSAAKVLYRHFAGSPCPLPAMPRRFRTLLRAARRLLHRALVACLRTVLREAGARCSQRAVRALLSPGASSKPTAAKAPLNCPLDLYRYGNDAAAATVPNCSAHVDRGLLSAVVLSPVSGLMLWDAEVGAFVAPERRWPGAAPHRHAVILVNHALQALDTTGPPPPRQPPLIACTHEVRKAEVPRISISYELRAASGNG